MAKTTEIDLMYVLGVDGWSDLYVLVGHDIQQFQISHVFSDPPRDLIALCTALLDGADGGRVRLPNEPGGVMLVVERRADQHHLATVSFYDIGDEADPDPDLGDVVLCFEVKIRHLVELFYHQFAKIERLGADKAWRRHRDDFPAAEFAAWRARRTVA